MEEYITSKLQSGAVMGVGIYQQGAHDTSLLWATDMSSSNYVAFEPANSVCLCEETYRALEEHGCTINGHKMVYVRSCYYEPLKCSVCFLASKYEPERNDKPRGCLVYQTDKLNQVAVCFGNDQTFGDCDREAANIVKELISSGY